MSGGIDHLVLCVNDLEAAADFYRRLGFTTTPRAQHDWGTDNILVQLNGCFLELLTVSRPKLIPKPSDQFSFGAHNHAFSKQQQGMSMLVFQTHNAVAEKQRLDNAGITPNDVFHFKRNAKLPSGETVEVAFSLAFAIDDGLPNAAFFYCQQHAPQYFWKPEYQRHDNTANTIRSVTLAHDEPDPATEFFQSLFGRSGERPKDDVFIFETPRGFLELVKTPKFSDLYPKCALKPQPSAPCFAAFCIAVNDIDVTRKVLESNSIAFHENDGELVVPSDQTFGINIRFAGL